MRRNVQPREGRRRRRLAEQFGELGCRAGALSGLVSKYHSVGQFTAFTAEQILLGKLAPSTIPIEPLKRFSYQVRISAAERLKLMPPLPMFNYAEIITDTPVSQ